MRHFQKWDESRRMGLNRYAKGGRPYDLIARSENAAQKPTRAPELFLPPALVCKTRSRLEG